MYICKLVGIFPCDADQLSSQFKCLSSLHFSCRGKGSVFGGCSAKGGVFNAKGKIKGKGKASPVKTVLFPGKQFQGVILCRLKWLKQRNETKSCHLKIFHWEDSCNGR